ncbi:MAG: sodium:proton exchanger [Candidatus Doudnabacteria bacterium CG10_big_fil_rev_8_21_14_0_10_41_10]|uniref:Sodium:proton exchanger n=1 Tax=Candidatus Doudnabacteria bacterium CG10_big_fil_rev_8_21_14_0_10_41_10 TaxID=1974551 RepID=A0A2H0VEY0_9BACT|nr:MAG: sodium:proton exchanger [Candidatus Doudnabacteria bacterium CG10_big_fil_rev_8_21_14_0_10_41_10]
MDLFTEITLLVTVAALVAFLVRLLKQPLIIGYIITGLLVGPVFLDLVHSRETLEVFSEIGVAFLLFIVGLNLTPKYIGAVGKVAVLTGFGQVIFTTSIGWLLARALGFGSLASLYIGIALAFSSTIIILKLLSDKGDLEKLYGKISIGFLLVQDFIAVFILFLVPLFSLGDSHIKIASRLILASSVLVVVYMVAHLLLSRLNRYVSRSQELLFLFAIAWGLGLSSIFRVLGFSLESGALIAGATLAILPSHDEIHSRLKPLRDFFIILFFILLGAEMVLDGSGNLIVPAIIFSLFVLIGNPIILMTIMGISGYRKKIGFQTGLTVAQISEFSLIVVALGFSFGHVQQEVLSLVTLIGIITIFVSTYMIMNSDKLFTLMAPFLRIFERKKIAMIKFDYEAPEVMLFGMNRMGYDFLKLFKKQKKDFMIIDHNPEVIDNLTRKYIPHKYGDAGDVEFLRLLDFKKLKQAISTIPDVKINELIIRELRNARTGALVVVTASNIKDALDLYKFGADYVIVPRVLAGNNAAKLIEDLSKSKFEDLKVRQVRYLKERLADQSE